MSNKRCELPPESWRAPKKGYEEVHVPAIRSLPREGDHLFAIKKLPEWVQPAFETHDKIKLNPK